MFTLPKLPYEEDALAPHISAQTMQFHYGKHHKGYVDALNKLLASDDLQSATLLEVIYESYDKPDSKTIFNNAAQCWNHDFFWKSMRPDGGGFADGDLKALMANDFGDEQEFSDAFVEAATMQFGSGWVWLVFNNGAVGIITTHDADLPIIHGQTPLLCCDLWEHAYYLDYQNKRADFVKVFLEKLANWEFASNNLAALNL